MNPLRRIILITGLLIAGISIAAVAQQIKPVLPKTPLKKQAVQLGIQGEAELALTSKNHEGVDVDID